MFLHYSLWYNPAVSGIVGVYTDATAPGIEMIYLPFSNEILREEKLHPGKRKYLMFNLFLIKVHCYIQNLYSLEIINL